MFRENFKITLLGEKMNIKTDTGKSSNLEITNRSEFYKLYKESPVVQDEKLDNLGLFLSRRHLSRIMFMHEMYQKIINVNGVIMEFGVRWGQNLALFENFRGMYEPYNHTRKIIGFDAFGKFPSDELKKIDSDQSFSIKHDEDAGYGISKSDLDIFLKKKNFSNYSLIRGDILKTLPDYLKNNPEKRFSLIHIDVDVYEPTKHILENTWDKIVEGGVLILDDYGTVEGETKAVDEFLHNKNILIQKLPYKYKPSFIIKKTNPI